MSELPRKSVAPMALRGGVPPRSRQAFLRLGEWDEDRLVDRVPQTVARDHAHPWAIGTVEETGCGKDGRHPACVQRPGCGSLGKVENGVVRPFGTQGMVHTGYAVGNFHGVLDSALFVPEDWADDPVRREEVGCSSNRAGRMTREGGSSSNLASTAPAHEPGLRWTHSPGCSAGRISWPRGGRLSVLAAFLREAKSPTAKKQ